MKRVAIMFLILFSACNQPVEKVRGVPSPAAVEAQKPAVEEEAERLREEGYQTFTYKDSDSTYLMQQYYIVLLKRGANRGQDSITAARLQEQHMAHLNRMYEEGYSSLAGPMGDDGDIRGIVIFNTPTAQMADSLSRLDPMVQEGRLEVEVRPWWVSKGGKLK